MTARRHTRRLAPPLIALLLAAGCATASRPAASNDHGSPTEDSAGQPQLPVTARTVENCSEISQTSTPSATSTSRLLDIDLPCLTAGPAVNPSKLAGRPVVINLWATWCEPCRQEMPLLQAAHRRYDAHVQFLGVNTKDRPEWAADFLQEIKVTYPQVVDAEGTLLGSLRSPGLPVTVVLDADGQVVGRHIGRINEQRLTELVTEAAR